MANLTSALTVKLIDDVSKPARSVSQALEEAAKRAQAVAKGMAGASATDKFVTSLSRLKLSAKDIEAVSKAWKEYSASAKLAANSAQWTKEQLAGVKRWESTTISALKTVQREQASFARASARAAKSAGGGGAYGEMSGRQLAAAIAGGYIAHKTAEFAKESLETYREFDRERRYAQVVMGLNDEQMEPLIRQAIHGSAVSKYNDIQWLEGQRDLASRGYGLDQVSAFAPVAALIGQAFDVSLPDGVKALEGAMLGFRKDTTTFEKAMAAAKRTADLEVKASKISGLSYDDIIAAYKFGASPATMGHLSEEAMLSFAAIAKKANMGGDESGTAFRALVKNLLSPTAGAKEAMMAAGIDYAKFQKGPRQGINMAGFVSLVARKYGVRLNKGAQAALGTIFNDPDKLLDPDQFTPDVTAALKGQLKGKDAKSLKSIAGLATRFRDASMSGVDTNGLLAAIMTAIVKNPALSNAIFGSKQGGRINAALGDADLYNRTKDQLDNHADGFAQTVSDKRMAGLDGAMARLENSTKNLETAIARALDNDGKGGFLTGAADKAARFVQALAEAPPSLQRLATTAGLAAAAFAGFKSVETLMGGFGLKGAAAALTEAATALSAAAAEQSASALGGLTGGKGKGALGAFKKIGNAIPYVGTAIAITEGLKELDDHIIPKDASGVPLYNQPPPGAGKGHWVNMGVRGGRHWVEDAQEAKTTLDQLNGSFKPNVDASAIQAAQAAAAQLLATLSSISGAASGAASAVAGIKVPSIGAASRSSFTPGGDPGR